MMETETLTNDSATQNMQPDKKVIKPKTAEKSMTKNIRINVLKKLDQDSAKLLSAIKDKINKKSVGRKIKDSEIIGLSLRQLSDDHITQLRQQTYSEKDRLALAHDEYQQNNGKITLDQFIGKLLNGEYAKK